MAACAVSADSKAADISEVGALGAVCAAKGAVSVKKSLSAGEVPAGWTVMAFGENSALPEGGMTADSPA